MRESNIDSMRSFYPPRDRNIFIKYASDGLIVLRVFISDISSFRIRQLNDPDLTFPSGGCRAHADGGGDGVKEFNAIFPA